MEIEICGKCGEAFVAILEEHEFNDTGVQLGGHPNLKFMRGFFPDEPEEVFPDYARCRNCREIIIELPAGALP